MWSWLSKQAGNVWGWFCENSGAVAIGTGIVALVSTAFLLTLAAPAIADAATVSAVAAAIAGAATISTFATAIASIAIVSAIATVWAASVHVGVAHQKHQQNQQAAAPKSAGVWNWLSKQAGNVWGWLCGHSGKIAIGAAFVAAASTAVVFIPAAAPAIAGAAAVSAAAIAGVATVSAIATGLVTVVAGGVHVGVAHQKHQQNQQATASISPRQETLGIQKNAAVDKSVTDQALIHERRNAMYKYSEHVRESSSDGTTLKNIAVGTAVGLAGAFIVSKGISYVSNLFKTTKTTDKNHQKKADCSAKSLYSFG